MIGSTNAVGGGGGYTPAPPEPSRNLWTTDQTYPLSNGILYDPDTQTYTVPTTAKALIAYVYALPTPIAAGTEVTLSVYYDSGRSQKGSVVVGGYHQGSDGNSWEPQSGNIAVNTDLAGTKKVVTATTTKTVTHFVIFVDSSVVGKIDEDIVFRVQYELGGTATEWVPH